MRSLFCLNAMTFAESCKNHNVPCRLLALTEPHLLIQGRKHAFIPIKALGINAVLPRDSALYDVSVRRPTVLPSGFLQTSARDNALAIN